VCLRRDFLTDVATLARDGSRYTVQLWIDSYRALGL
jgi:hypothetical protein